MLIAKNAYSFDIKYEALKFLHNKIKNYENKRNLIAWIDQVFQFEIDDNIMGIEIEMDENVKFTSICIDILILK